MKKESVSVKVKSPKITTERILVMTTLTQKILNYNKQIKLSDDGGSLSSDSGQFLVRELDEKLGFSKTIDKYLTLNDDRLYYKHSNIDVLRQKIYQIIAGYNTDSAAQALVDDPVFTQDRKSTRLNSSHVAISYAVFCLKKKTNRAHYIEY